MPRFKVIGDVPVVDDTTGEDVFKGGTVELDDTIPGRNIPALIQSGCIAPPNVKADPKPEGDKPA